MHQTVARTYAVLLHGVRLATAAALVLLVAVVSASVVVRYFGLFGGSPHCAAELSRFTVVWVTMLGSVIAFGHGAHLAIGLFQEALPPAARRWVEAAAYLLSLVFVTVLAWSGFQLAMVQSVLFAIFPDVRIGNRDEPGPDAPPPGNQPPDAAPWASCSPPSCSSSCCWACRWRSAWA